MGNCCCKLKENADSSVDDQDKTHLSKFTKVNRNDEDEKEDEMAGTRKQSNGNSETTKEQTAAHIALTNVHVQLINVIISYNDRDNNNPIETRLPVMNTLTISQMKQLIHKHIGIEEHQQLLKYNDMIVDNNQPLYFYDIKDGDILHLIVIENTDIVKINVDYKSGTIKQTIYVSLNSTFVEFRKEVQGKIPNVALNEQQFFYNNIQLTDDNKLLKDYNITNNCTLRFEWKSVF
eukprot:435748_1